MAALDELLLLDIYPAREEPIPGINSAWLLDHVNMASKTLCTRTSLMDELARRDLDVVLTLGAGDIDQLVAPIERLINERYKP